MARFAIIDAGRVTNHAEADEEFASSQGWIQAGESRIGDLWDGSKFTPPAVDLVALKAAKNAEINAARLAANFTSFTHAGKAIACDQLSRSDIDGTNGFVGLYGTLPPGWPGGWKAVDTTYVPISSVDGWKAFYSSMFAAGNANFAKAQALKTQLEAATTAAEVQAIVW
jgi:hypothetical protein